MLGWCIILLKLLDIWSRSLAFGREIHASLEAVLGLGPSVHPRPCLWETTLHDWTIGDRAVKPQNKAKKQSLVCIICVGELRINVDCQINVFLFVCFFFVLFCFFKYLYPKYLDGVSWYVGFFFSYWSKCFAYLRHTFKWPWVQVMDIKSSHTKC